jgi:hypothetical protein
LLKYNEVQKFCGLSPSLKIVAARMMLLLFINIHVDLVYRRATGPGFTGNSDYVIKVEFSIWVGQFIHTITFKANEDWRTSFRK